MFRVMLALIGNRCAKLRNPNEVKFKNGKHVGFYKQYSRKNGSVSIEKIDGNTEFGW